MSKTRNPVVEVTFGGKVRHLCFDFNARAELEDIAGTFASEVPKLKALRATVWACLLAETLDGRGRETKDTLSIQQVGQILDQMSDKEVEILSLKVLEAMNLSAPEGETERPIVAENPQA